MPTDEIAPAERGEESKKSGRRWRRFLLQLTGSCLFLGLIFSIVDIEVVRTAFLRLPLWLWGLVVGLHCGLHAIQAGKWQLVLGMMEVRMSRSLAWRGHAAGQFGGIILPSLVGGDAVRATIAVREIGHPEAVVFGGLVDRLFDIAGMLTIVAIGFTLAPSALAPPTMTVNLGVLAILVLAAGATWGSLRLIFRPRFLRRLPRRVARSLLRARRAVGTMRLHPRSAAGAFLVSLFVQASFVVTAILVADSLAFSMDLRLWFLIWPLAKLASMMPASLGGIGLLELSFSVLTAPFADGQLAVGVALVMQTIRIGLGLVCGAYYLAANR